MAKKKRTDALKRIERSKRQEKALNADLHPKTDKRLCPRCKQRRAASRFPGKILSRGAWVRTEFCAPCILELDGGRRSVRARPQPMPGKSSR